MGKKTLCSVRISYVFLQGILLAPWFLMPITSGLDPSWIYGLNVYNIEHVIFGRDLLFTYGPLGYILFPQPVGNNIASAFSILMLFFLAMLGTTAFILFSKSFAHINHRMGNLLASLFFLYIAFLAGNYIPEYWTTYILLMVLSAILVKKSRHTYWFMIIAVLITVISMFIKFNTGILNLICMYIFLFLLFMQKSEQIKLFAIIIIVGIPAIFTGSYLLYNFSFHDLGVYAYSAINISSGYIYNMSMEVKDTFYTDYIAALMIIFLGCLCKITHDDKKNGLYAILFLFAFFITFKHGIVRGDHITVVPTIFCLYFSIYILFMKADITEYLQGKIKYLVMVLCIALVAFPMHHRQVSNLLQPLYTGVDHIQTLVLCTVHENRSFKQLDQREAVMDRDFSAVLGQHSMTIYPWEFSLYNIGEHVYRPIPVFSINVGTVFLDQKNADFFAADNAPEYIILSLETVDNQYPLINNPAMWMEILKRYDVVDYDDKNFLLAKRNSACESVETEIETRSIGKNDTITIPESSSHILIKVDADLSLKGNLAKLLYRIPEVNMDAVLNDGSVYHQRIILNVWQNPVMIDVIPKEKSDFVKIMDDTIDDGRKVKEIRFSGEGLAYYKDNIKITFSSVDLNKKGFTMFKEKSIRLKNAFSIK